MHTKQDQFGIETSPCAHPEAPAPGLPFNITLQVSNGRWNWLCLSRRSPLRTRCCFYRGNGARKPYPRFLACRRDYAHTSASGERSRLHRVTIECEQLKLIVVSFDHQRISG